MATKAHTITEQCVRPAPPTGSLDGMSGWLDGGVGKDDGALGRTFVFTQKHLD